MKELLLMMEKQMLRKARQRWMGILAKTGEERIESAFKTLGTKPAYEFLRKPETGMLMVRARMNGTGGPFHFGEVLVTRCTVKVKGGKTGTAYVKGSSKKHAEIAALFDSLLQDDSRDNSAARDVIEILSQELVAAREKSTRKTDGTRVDFFTMVRGE